MTDSPTRKSALISGCETYRYRLERVWDWQLPRLVFIMLNPSTADHTVDDPTIQRCMGFARRLGYGGILVVNLFAFRSPHPSVMEGAVDPIGPDNDNWIIDALLRASHSGAAVIAAWGTGGGFMGRDQKVARLAEYAGVTLHCLGRTKDGHPKHPLARGHHRIPDDFTPIPLVEAA